MEQGRPASIPVDYQDLGPTSRRDDPLSYQQIEIRDVGISQKFREPKLKHRKRGAQQPLLDQAPSSLDFGQFRHAGMLADGSFVLAQPCHSLAACLNTFLLVVSGMDDSRHDVPGGVPCN